MRMAGLHGTVAKLSLVLQMLVDHGFEGVVRIKYTRKAGPKHLHVESYVDLEAGSEPALLRWLQAQGIEVEHDSSAT
jgi:hypothetical protein